MKIYHKKNKNKTILCRKYKNAKSYIKKKQYKPL